MTKNSININDNSEISEAIAQLNEVLRHTEESVMSILDSAKNIEEHKSHPAAVSKYVTSIYDACAFQDISTQRIKKVLKQLMYIDGEVQSLGGIKKRPRKASEELLEGPQLAKNKPSQDMIDKTFSEN